MSRTLSVPSPLDNARNTTSFCYLAQSQFPSVNLPGCCDPALLRQMHPAALSVAIVCAFYLCRISELLQLRTSDVISEDRVFCRGKKRSSSYIIYLPGLSCQLSHFGSQLSTFSIFGVSYSVCYRSFVRAGIRHCRPGRHNTMRTHAARYTVSQLLDGTLSPIESGDLLHHNSRSSISYYNQ